MDLYFPGVATGPLGHQPRPDRALRRRPRPSAIGRHPARRAHPRDVADVLEKLGRDTTEEQPKLLTRDTIAASTTAITLGCGEECPYVPGVKYVDWPVDDPGGQDETTVRRNIADLDGRVRGLLVELVPDLELPPRCRPELTCVPERA
jgi:arsenate reductase (thioredoxin)